MRNVVIIAVLAMAALAAYGRKDESLDQLIARAESVRMEERPAIYAEIAERKLADASQLYSAGKEEDARAAVNDVVTYSDKAGEAATRSGKKLKNTEIAVRKMAARLRDLKRELAFEDQGPVQSAIEHLEQVRTQLLSRMFGNKKEGK